MLLLTNVTLNHDFSAGLLSASNGRLKYEGDLEGYDRKFEELHATVWLNTTDGSWYAKRTQAGKLTMGELAEVGMEGLTVADILDAALQAAPRAKLEH